MLIQRRALGKYHTPGLWANTCCTHPRWGEAICVVVQPKVGAMVAEAELLAHCASRLGGFQRPKRALILDVLPMTATGKIRKAELRQTHAALFEGDDAR